MDRYDVVVVGARVAGAATAMLLAREGAHVLVVDRARYGSDTNSTHALMRGGVQQLARWGLLDEIVAAGTPPVHTTIFHYEDTSVPVTIKPANGVDALYAPRRTVLDRVLADAARDAGAEFRFETTVRDVVRDDHGAVAGVVGPDLAVRAGVVIGADGINSLVARRVNAPVERQTRHAGTVVYGYWDDLDAAGYEWAYSNGAAAGLIPTNDGQVLVFTGTAPRRARPYQKVLATASPELAERVAAAKAPLRMRTFRGEPGFMRTAHGRGWALVGDAGYFKDPISSHGITDALRDAELLARAITRGSLAEYQATRDAVSADLLAVTDRVASYDWDTDEIKRLLRELSASMSHEIELINGFDDEEVAA